MSNKSLDEKIKFVAFWTFGGVFWYLVISFFLVSDYPIQNYSFNHKNAYDIVKDALTLAAAFLAPVAAFILFSNWREQYLEVEIEKNGIELYERLLLVRDELSRIETDISSNFSENKDDLDDRLRSLLSEKLFEINILKNRLRKRNSATRSYCSMADQVGEDINNCFSCLLSMYTRQNKITNPKEFNFEYTGETDDDFKDRHQVYFEDFQTQFYEEMSKLFKDLSSLDILSDSLRIRN